MPLCFEGDNPKIAASCCVNFLSVEIQDLKTTTEIPVMYLLLTDWIIETKTARASLRAGTRGHVHIPAPDML